MVTIFVIGVIAVGIFAIISAQQNYKVIQEQERKKQKAVDFKDKAR